MLLFTAAVLIGAPALMADNPLAPALAGKLECTSPDDQRKTCRSITQYTHLDGPNYSGSATILLSPQGPVVLLTKSPAVVRGNAVCGTIKRDDLTSGQLQVGDRYLRVAEAAPILERIATQLAPIIGKEICQTYESSAQGMIEHGTIDGVSQPKGDERVKWIGPTDGYVVAP